MCAVNNFKSSMRHIHWSLMMKKSYVTDEIFQNQQEYEETRNMQKRLNGKMYATLPRFRKRSFRNFSS
jgi:hypothetical protein